MIYLELDSKYINTQIEGCRLLPVAFYFLITLNFARFQCAMQLFFKGEERCKLRDKRQANHSLFVLGDIATKLKILRAMNIFSALRIYAGKWDVSDSRSFSQDEINAVASATVVDSQYGQSVCFVMKTGGMTFIPLDQNSHKATGDSVDLSSAKLLTLSKQGEDDIYRVSC